MRKNILRDISLECLETLSLEFTAATSLRPEYIFKKMLQTYLPCRAFRGKDTGFRKVI